MNRPPTPPLRYPLTLPPVQNLSLLDPLPSHLTQPSSKMTTNQLWKSLKSSSKPCGSETTNANTWLTSWSDGPESCWSSASKPTGSKRTTQPPPGFVLNGLDKALYFTIPSDHGFARQAHWVQRLPNGQVAGLPEEYTPNQKPFIADIFADAMVDEDEEPVLPFPCWLHDALVGPAAGCAAIFNHAAIHLDWGIHADLCRYRQAEINVIDLEGQIESLKAQVRCLKQAQAGARNRLELAYVDKKLSQFRTTGLAYGTMSLQEYKKSAHNRNLHGRGWKQRLDGDI